MKTFICYLLGLITASFISQPEDVFDYSKDDYPNSYPPESY